MEHLTDSLPPVRDTQIADAIAAWVRRAPRQILTELLDSEAREEASKALGEMIAAEMTMAYPELVESSAPPLPFMGGE